MIRNDKKWPPVVIALPILSLALGAALVFGQGGSGRAPQNGSGRPIAKPKTSAPSRKPTRGTRPAPSPSPEEETAEESSVPIPAVQWPVYNYVWVDERGRILRVNQGRAETITEVLGNGVRLEMVKIPGGTFLMGTTKAEAQEILTDAKRYGGDPNLGGLGFYLNTEMPQHQVTVRELYVGQFEVTQAQWTALMGNNPSTFEKGDDFPVHNVSWNEAIEFCRRLSQRTGRQYRLPSEAEWEYACRANTTTPFSFGETITPNLVNYYGALPFKRAPKGIGRSFTSVGYMGVANPFGLFDMNGNVYEWCLDHWHPNYVGAPNNGDAWIAAGDPSLRVARGGSSNLAAVFTRSASRYNSEPGKGYPIFGVRVVMLAR